MDINDYLLSLLNDKIKCPNCNNLLIGEPNDFGRFNTLHSVHCIDCLPRREWRNFYTQINYVGEYYLNKGNKNIYYDSNNEQVRFGNNFIYNLSIIENLKFELIIRDDQICFDEMFVKLSKLVMLQ